MSIEDEYYNRGLSFLQKNPPNLIKALSLIRKAKKLYEEKGKVKEYNAAMDKLHFIYKMISERNYDESVNLLRTGKYRDSILKALKSYNYTLLAEPKNPQRASKKVKTLIEKSSIEYLSNIERNIKKEGFSELYLNEMYFVTKTIRDTFFPGLKNPNGVIPDNFISKIASMRKFQRILINTHETIGNKAKDKAKQLIKDGNIKQSIDILNISRSVYNKAGFNNKTNELKPLYSKVYEAQGDAEFTKGQQLAEAGRMNKGREHIKRARLYYKKAENTKKEELSKKNYLSISMKIGEYYLKQAEEAEKFGDYRSAMDVYEKAHSFFTKINHKKSITSIEKKKMSIYRKLGDKEYSAAENLKSNDIQKAKLSSEALDLNLPTSIAVDAEYILKRIQYYRDALFYYQKTENAVLINKTLRKINQYTEKIAELMMTQARKNIRANRYEQAFLDFKRCLFYYESIDNKRRVKVINEQIKKIINKIDRKKLEQIERVLYEQQHIISEQKFKENKVEPTKFMESAQGKEQYHCVSCGKWVPGYFYDSIQEKCLDCREKYKCDECNKDIIENEIYMECLGCGAKFCLDCADRVFDFVQKKCTACREIQICGVCGVEARMGQVFNKCSKCGKVYCDLHWDKKQDVCVNCAEVTKCKECGKQIEGDAIFKCSVCNEPFCSEHFDKARGQCMKHREEGICAKCGILLKQEDKAYKCPNCGFLYCPTHFSEYHNKCHVCLGDLVCYDCKKELFDEEYFTCVDCKHIFCSDHYNMRENRCKHCKEISSQCAECNKILNGTNGQNRCKNCSKYFCNEHFNNQDGLCFSCAKIVTEAITIQNVNEFPETAASGSTNQQGNNTSLSESNRLISNTLNGIIEKYNHRELLEPEEINFLHKYQINLPKENNEYVNIGDTGDNMILLLDKESKPFVALIPNTPIAQDCKYYGDLMQKLAKYIPEVPKTIDGTTTIMNLLFYAANNPKWIWIYQFLRQTLLKQGIEALNLLMLIFKKAPNNVISDALVNTSFHELFAGMNVDEIIDLIKTNEFEDEIGLFSENEKLDQLLRAFYCLNRGDVLKSAEILSIFDLE